jgi:EPS-associated MarR family transcriptional regulator
MTRDGPSLATPMPARQTLIQEDTSYRILRILQANPEINQRDLARHLGMSLGGLNYCLRALMDKGYVKLDNFQNSKHRFKYVYLLTPAGLAQKVAMTGRFLKRKMDEYEALRAEIETLKAEVGAGETAAAEGRADAQPPAPTARRDDRR